MSKPLDELYFEWLYSQVGPLRLKNPKRTHWSLLQQLHRKEFVWIVPNDDNRVQDGKDLRREFLEFSGIDDVRPDSDWMGLGCSMLEMLIALSRHLAFETDGEDRVWFWHLIETLDLMKYNDHEYKNDRRAERKIDDVLNRIIFRTYAPNGRGGLFPLRRPQQDQREVEIRYQLSAYLLEQFY
jgi:hypothetical protein